MLSAATSDDYRRQLQEQLIGIEKEIKENVSEIQYQEGGIQYGEREIARIRGGAEERQRKEGE